MWRAIKKAEEVYNKYGNDLDVILDALGIEVLEISLEGRVREIFFADYVVIKKDLSEPEKRELIAHALGHYFLHAGNHLAFSQSPVAIDNYHERQADVFAACLLMPESKINKSINNKKPIFEVADIFYVSEALARFRCDLFKQVKGIKNENTGIVF